MKNFSLGNLKEGFDASKHSFKMLLLAGCLGLTGCLDVAEDEDEDGNGGSGASGFSKFFYPIVEEANCGTCHASQSGAAQTPFFADADVNQAEQYLLASGAVILNDAQNSSIVRKMQSAENHFCGDQCSNYADRMIQAIINWGGESQVDNSFNPLRISSSSITYADAMNGGSARNNNGVIALYEFKSCADNEVKDTSGVEPAIDLTIMGGATCTPNSGISFDGQAGTKAQGSAADSARVHAAIAGGQGSGAFTIEAWVTYESDNSDGRIFVYDQSNAANNFQMRQNNTAGIRQQFNVRTGTTGANGSGGGAYDNVPDPAAAVGQRDHIVMTFDQQNHRRIYVNGVLGRDNDNLGDPLLNTWDANFQIAMGSANNNNNPWVGTLHFAALYDRALSPAEVAANFNAGVAEVSNLSFDISGLTGVENTSITMRVRELDEFSYVLSQPTLVAPEGVNLGIQISGLLIAVNDYVGVTSQAFSQLNITLEGNGQVLSEGGALVAKKDPSDKFTLVFQQFGNDTNMPDPVVFTRAPATASGTPTVKHGIKNFEQIPRTFSKLTGVPLTNQAFAQAIAEVEASFLENNQIDSFKPSKQTAVQKLSLVACQQVSANQNLRSAFYPRITANGFSAQNLADDLKESILQLDANETLTTVPMEFESIMLGQIAASQDANISEENTMIGSCAVVLGSSLVTVH